ncbi:MAG: sulfite exporter TauE/SafE family protein [Oscillospiraceae bacterium]|nr:sulfite exporter TauE/SafE family protein [Oscillospiraceae bacterium]
MKKFFKGLLCGGLNGLFGSGGGVIAVPILENDGCTPQQAHATSVALIFVLSLVTTVSYLFGEGIDIKAAWQYIPWGLGGAVAGSLFLRKIKSVWLHRVFGALIIAAAIRTLFS